MRRPHGVVLFLAWVAAWILAGTDSEPGGWLALGMALSIWVTIRAARQVALWLPDPLPTLRVPSWLPWLALLPLGVGAVHALVLERAGGHWCDDPREGFRLAAAIASGIGLAAALGVAGVRGPDRLSAGGATALTLGWACTASLFAWGLAKHLPVGQGPIRLIAAIPPSTSPLLRLVASTFAAAFVAAAVFRLRRPEPRALTTGDRLLCAGGAVLALGTLVVHELRAASCWCLFWFTPF